MKSRPKSIRRLAGLAGAALFATAMPVEALPPPAPTPRLIAMRDQVTIYSSGDRMWLNLGVLTTAEGGDFELEVARPDYDSATTLVQVDSDTGEILREFPAAEMAPDFKGLRSFVSVTFRRNGQAVKKKVFDFCPNTWNRQRVDDAGPEFSEYPSFCSWHSPFFKGNMWGIDHHWAVNALAVPNRWGDSDSPSIGALPDGNYRVIVAYTPQYRQLLGIPADDARVGLSVTVETYARGSSAASEGERFVEEAEVEPVEGVPTTVPPDPSTVPDLVAPPAWDIGLRSQDGHDLLGFAATPWNAGPRPMVVEGFRRPNEDVMDAFQYFYDADGNVVGRAPVGTMAFDTRRGHHHWHFRQFARYSLLTEGQELVRSKKQSFCIYPTDAIDLTVEGASWTGYGQGHSSVCGGSDSIWVREALQPGWGDTYYQTVAGQALDVTDVPNGCYELRAEVNPAGKLYEVSTANNSESRTVCLGGGDGDRRTLTVSPWHGINP